MYMHILYLTTHFVYVFILNIQYQYADTNIYRYVCDRQISTMTIYQSGSNYYVNGRGFVVK